MKKENKYTKKSGLTQCQKIWFSELKNIAKEALEIRNGSDANKVFKKLRILRDLESKLAEAQEAVEKLEELKK